MPNETKVPIIAFANHKGGVGKSTTTLQVSYYLAEKFVLANDKKLLVIDMDPQGNTSTRMMGQMDLEGIGGTR